MSRHGGGGWSEQVEGEIQRRKSEWLICLVDVTGKLLSTVGVNHPLSALCISFLWRKCFSISCISHIITLRMHTLAVMLTTFCSSAIKHYMVGLFSLTTSSGCVSLLPVVHVNGVLLGAAAPLQAFLIRKNLHLSVPCSTLTLGNLRCGTKGLHG